MKTLKELTNELGEMLEEKQKAYGDAIEESGKFLSVLYPNGIPPESYQTVALLVRMFDKMKRIANGASNENSWKDLAGYSVQGWKIMLKEQQTKEGLENLNKFEETIKKKFSIDGFDKKTQITDEPLKTVQNIKKDFHDPKCYCRWCVCNRNRKANDLKQSNVKKCFCGDNEECYCCSTLFKEETKKFCNCFGTDRCSKCS